MPIPVRHIQFLGDSGILNTIRRKIITLGSYVRSVYDYIDLFVAWVFEASETLEALEAPDYIGVEDRDVQPGRYFAFDGSNDHLDRTMASIGTLYVSAVKTDGTLASNVTISHDGTKYRVTSTVAQDLFNVKIWSDNTATNDEKLAFVHDSLPSMLMGWMKCDEDSGLIAYDSSGNGLISTW